MATGYYLQDNPNKNFAQYGWPRKKVSGVIGVHTTESGVDFEGADAGAENTAAFIGRRPDPGGYHALADADSRIKLVHPRYAAWADTTNNAHAMSVSAAMNAARWRDLSPARAAAIVRNLGLAAAQLVQDALAAGLLATAPPARRITPQEAISGSKAGFYGHGETNPGRRYDPGTNFDWDLFLSTYANAVGVPAAGSLSNQSSIPTSTTESEEDFMAGTIDAQQAEDIAQRAAELVVAALNGKVLINPQQAEDIVHATTTRTADAVDARNTGKLIDRGQADDIARAAARYSEETP